MDIAFVNRPLGMTRGGGEIWDLEMARALHEMGEEVTIYTGKPLTSDISKPVDLPVKKIPSPFLYDLGYKAPIGIGGVITDVDRQLFISQTRRYLEDRHDIVHVNGYPEFFRIRDQIDCPMTITLNGPPHSLFYNYLHPTKSSYYWLEKADKVIANTITTEKVEARIDVDVVTVNPGVDVDKFSTNGPECETNGPTILWVGRFVPAKNLTELIDGFTLVQEEHPDAELWLVGEGGRMNEIKSRAKENGIKDSVRFCGYFPNSELPPLYRAADVYGHTSKHESFGMVLLEAMACGTPVVAPEIDYIPQIVSDGDTGLLYESGDEQHLAKCLTKLMDDDELCHSMGKKGARATRNHHSWKSQATKLKKIFEEVINSPKVDF